MKYIFITLKGLYTIKFLFKKMHYYIMPYSKKANYYHKRQKSPEKFKSGTFKTVAFNHAKYRGKKYEGYHKSGTQAKAVVGKLKTTGKWSTQSILIPKKKKR